MTESGAGLSTHDAGSLPSSPFPAASRLAAALSLLTVGACCLLLMQLDVPLLRFLRSLDLSSMQRMGDLGEKVGNGGTLVAVSLGLLVFGWAAGRKQWVQAGVESLLAHGCVALLVNGLKHLIGRPRPRLTHSGEWQWWPSWQSGLDSFPSGHTSATFAVVTVLVRHWPAVAWPGYGVATWVAMSRVWRGSHFATDVVAGMVAGVVVGSVFASPLREWRETLSRAIVRITPLAVTITSVLWLALRRVDDPWTDRLLSVVGCIVIAVGLVVRLTVNRDTVSTAWRARGYRAGIMSVGLGLSFTTGSWALVGLAWLSASAWWLHTEALRRVAGQEPYFAGQPLQTPVYVLGILVAALLIQELKGIVPIQ